MPPDFNRVTLIGRLTRDPEVRHTSGNTAIANFGLAVGRKYKLQSGEQREETMFIDCEAWGKTGELIAQYVSKGRPLFIEGRLKLDQWEDKNGGGKRSKHVMVVENFQFIDSGGGGGEGGGGARRTAGAGASAGRGGGSDPVVDHDDIPF
ncbi:MAG: single-stranded DNA-binding protein [Phycisphaeraceae bacterium]|nr:MAG: single-stranded DNA-binding protein [Phycisphaeraceae bacterium]